MRRLGWAFLVPLAVLNAQIPSGARDFTGNCANPPESPVMIVPVRVLDRDLHPIDHLQSANSSIRLGNRSLPVCNLVHRRLPLSMGILLDVSGSMQGTGDRRLPALIQAGVEEFLAASGPQDEYFLEYASETASIAVGWTSDLSSIRSQLKIVPKGRTALIDGIYLALDVLRKARHTNRALLIFTDATTTSVFIARAKCGKPWPTRPCRSSW